MGASPLISEFWSRVWDIYRENREPIIALLTLIGGAIAAVATAWFTLRQARIAKRRDAEQTNADQQRKITEIITNAVEQLGSKKIQVRLGGIYMLEHISRESASDYWPVMEILTGFVRECVPWRGDDPAVSDKTPQQSSPPTDIAAVLTVIMRRDNQSREREKSENWQLDLRSTDLRGAFLLEAHLEGAVLIEAHLEGANLFGAHLERANLFEAHLEGAILEGTIGLLQVELVRSFGNAETLLPKGLTRPAHWPSG